MEDHNHDSSLCWKVFIVLVAFAAFTSYLGNCTDSAYGPIYTVIDVDVSRDMEEGWFLAEDSVGNNFYVSGNSHLEQAYEEGRLDSSVTLNCELGGQQDGALLLYECEVRGNWP